MKIEELKNNWNTLDIPPEYGNILKNISTQIERGQVNTLRDRLARISRALVLICVGGVFVNIPLYQTSHLMTILVMCFFVMLGSLHLLTYRRVSSLNFSRMNVREAINSVIAIERNRIRIRALGMTFGIPLAIYMTMVLSSTFGPYSLYGCVAGGIVGCVIGLLINHRAVMIIREMKSQLNQSVIDEDEK